VLAPLLVAFAACAPLEVTTQLAYMRSAIDGELTLAPASGIRSTPQDVDGAFGLGDDRESPFARVVADFGTPVLRGSGFWLHESGRGVLDDDFGGLPAGTSVQTDLDLGVFELTGELEWTFGPLTVAPGVSVDLLALDFRAETSASNREEIDELVVVPMPSLRATLEPGAGVALSLEASYLDARGLFDSDARFADVEASVVWPIASHVHVLAGFRWLDADAEAVTATDDVRIDVEVRGWYVGGGFRF
jgi:hypothetical protein